ncbi:hypothetical protein H4Q26_014268 [Puccinia striiformis f. sp. tritici PST-130]|nr:hypothetical protein H4Q26_014268 [Puccinia striiformis f. sp. tritici PST-130]
MMADIAPARHNPTLPPAQVDPTPESNKAMIIIVALCIIREAKGSSEESIAPDDQFCEAEKLKKYRASLKKGLTLVQPRHKPNGTYHIRHTRTGKIKKNDLLPLSKQNRPTIVLSSDDECMEEASKIINNQARPQVISRDGHSTSDDEQSSTCFEEGDTIEQLQKKM